MRIRSSEGTAFSPRPNATLPATVSHGKSTYSWKTTPRSAPGPLMARPSTSTRPDVGGRKPATMLRSVDLPQPEAHAREDLGERRWQQDAEEELARPGPETLGRAHEERIDPADGVDGGEEHREERRVRDEADLGLLADANPHDEERQHREWRDRAQQLDHRLDGTTDGAEVSGGQTDREREHGAGAEAQGDALERGAHVSPELAVQRELHDFADDEPRPGQEDRIDEPEGLHDSCDERPRREEERDRADAHPQRAPARQRGAAQAPLHHLGDGRQQGRLDRAPLLFPRIVGRIDVRDAGWAHAVDLNNRLFFRPCEVRRLRRRDEEAAGRKRLALRLAQLRTVARVERSGDDGHVLVGGMRVSRDLVVRGEFVPEGEWSRLSGVALEQSHLQARRQRGWAVRPFH